MEIRHPGSYSTRYAHLWRFAKGLHQGDHVRQGQLIGYVGESGEATGPHLHFEIRVNGKALDPLTVKVPGGGSIPATERAHYQAQIRPMVAALDERTPAPARLAGEPSRRKAPFEQMAKAAPEPADGTGG